MVSAQHTLHLAYKDVESISRMPKFEQLSVATSRNSRFSGSRKEGLKVGRNLDWIGIDALRSLAYSVVFDMTLGGICTLERKTERWEEAGEHSLSLSLALGFWRTQVSQVAYAGINA